MNSSIATTILESSDFSATDRSVENLNLSRNVGPVLYRPFG